MIAERLAELVAIRSTADRPDELERALSFVLDQVGPGFSVRRFHSRGKPSALVQAGTGPLRLILNAHLDVVPASDEQFIARRDGNRLYGRGTQDMKAAALVMAEVFRSTATSLEYAVGLQLVTDEEVGGLDGTAHQIDAGVRAGFVVIGEHSGLRVTAESKGILQARLEATGSAAHAAYPWLGTNALLELTAGLDRLLARYPVPSAEAWTTTVNVARIETPNTAFNQIPASATALVDIRYPADDEDLTGRTPEELADHLGAVTGLSVRIEALGPPHRADPDSPDLTRLRAALRSVGGPGTFVRKHGAADSRHYHAVGVDAVICGPTGDGQHGREEYVDLTSLVPYGKALTAFLLSLDPR
jgi:succinyl-diaminopimelate desuccinylase